MTDYILFCQMNEQEQLPNGGRKHRHQFANGVNVQILYRVRDGISSYSFVVHDPHEDEVTAIECQSLAACNLTLAECAEIRERKSEGGARAYWDR